MSMMEKAFYILGGALAGVILVGAPVLTMILL